MIKAIKKHSFYEIRKDFNVIYIQDGDTIELTPKFDIIEKYTVEELQSLFKQYKKIFPKCNIILNPFPLDIKVIREET